MSRRPLIELATFTALAAFCSYHWLELVAGPPLGRGAAMVAIALALGIALRLLATSRMRRWALVAVAGALAVAALGSSLAAMGVPARLLLPSGWAEFGDQLATGLEGSSKIELPYAGPEEWTRLGVLLLAPVAVTVAAALAFWPARRRARALRVAALVVLVALYAIAVTWEAPGFEPARGLALLVLVAAWVWLPVLRSRRLATAGAAVLAAGALALPAASALADSEPLLDYRDWTLFGDQREVTFDWDHSYGPLDWPQRGTPLLEIRADRPLYWKTSVLDSFDGHRWLRGAEPAALVTQPGAQAGQAGASQEMVERHRAWVEFPGVEVRALDSDFLVTSGTTLAVNGADVEPRSADGTTLMDEEPLERGDSYSVTVYAPDPSPRQMRRAPQEFRRSLSRYTSMTLPIPPAPELEGPSAPAEFLMPFTFPLRGSPAARFREPGTRLDGSEYERTYELARRLTADAATNYDAVRAVEGYLRDGFDYTQNVPDHPHPLSAFLFGDRAGYCQHFAGAMALLLRMNGIPARVVSGFAPGSNLESDNKFEVRDYDAHSWVEVYFPRIGWVTFDPTPAAAPAESLGSLAVRPRGEESAARVQRILDAGPEDVGDTGGLGLGTGETADGGPPWTQIVLLAVLAALSGVFWRRRRLLVSPEGALPQLREVERALPLLGWELPAGATLRQAEERLRGRAGPEVTRYLSGLRANRYGRARRRRPGPAERRAMRSALSRGGGLRRRVRALVAIPPGGPRPAGGEADPPGSAV